MDKQFDELSKSLAEGVSRREAVRKFGVGLAGVALAALGLQHRASADGCLAQCAHSCAAACGGKRNACYTTCYNGCIVNCRF